ncbi:MAG: maleylpyruvate isomerase family mycothiol-dependent enzyme [Actinomycetota bacterium]
MDQPHRLDRARQDGERLIALCSAHPEAAVPACPGWDAAKLLSHMTNVWHMLAIFAESRPDGFPDRDAFPPMPEPGGEEAAARAALDRVDAAMRALAPGTPMWSWGTTQSSDYFHRRYHLENLVHRIDAEQAAGVESDIDGDEAADSIDERFTEFVHRREERPRGSLHLHRTDGAGEWTVAVVDDEIVVRQEHAKGDAAARGSGADLMLAMWGRGPADVLDVFGDESLLDEWFELCR